MFRTRFLAAAALLGLAACASRPPAPPPAPTPADAATPPTASASDSALTAADPAYGSAPGGQEASSATALVITATPADNGMDNGAGSDSTALAVTAPGSPGDTAPGHTPPAPADQPPPAADSTPADGAGQHRAEAAAAAPTEAEADFTLLYGDSELDGHANLPPGTDPAAAFDPWEPLNRRTHAFNNFFDRLIARPLARAYVAVLPRPVRLGIGNFFTNLGQPLSATNALLQGRPGDAASSLMRFVINAAFGLGGVFDPATAMGIPFTEEDFGQTLAIWGWHQSRYLELPLLGPRTLRDALATPANLLFSPIRHLDNDAARLGTQGLQLLDRRASVLPFEGMRNEAADDYLLVRDLWLQRRQHQIQREQKQSRLPGHNEGEALPDYLSEPDIGTPGIHADPPVLPPAN